MKHLCTRRHVDASQQAAFHFALGKALEDEGLYDEAFREYDMGNAIKHRADPFDIEAFEKRCQRIAEVFWHDLLSIRDGPERRQPIPIFIVGLPRSGSTLLEQMLASHALVSGTMELPQVQGYARELNAPDGVRAMQSEDFDALGQRYLKDTAPLRGDAEYFIDKMPNNFLYIGLIHLMLPDAIFIDARRHPLDCCVSIFKQNFARGQTFSYNQDVLGRYYQSYLAMMRHWQLVLPGRVLQVQYEETEHQVRRLLDHCGLEFEQSCLDFHQTKRPVHTASAEQVRQPINRKGLGVAKRFDAHLGALKSALGKALTNPKLAFSIC